MELNNENLKMVHASLENVNFEGAQLENPDRVKLASIISERSKTKKGMRKTANISYDQAYSMTRIPLNYNDPLYDPILLNFPEYNLPEANKRYRHFYKFHPVFGSCVDIHATFPLSDFEIMVDNEEIKEYFTFLAEKYNLLEMSECNLRDLALLGESVFIGNWDNKNLEWEDWTQYPPEFVEVSSIPGMPKKVFTIKPDPEFQRIIQENTDANKILKDIIKSVNSEYYKAAENEEDYQIPEDRIIYLANKVDGYSKRGYALTKRALQDLMYEQQVRMLQHIFVQRHLFPIKIFKLGSRELGWIPSQKHFQQFKKLLIQASADPDFNLIYHFGLEVDYVGTKDKIENLIPHFEFTAKRIMNAYFCNDALINGEAPSYAGQTANIRMLMYRFMTKRSNLEKAYREKIYFPISRQQELIKQTKGEKSKNILVKSKNFSNRNYYLPEFLWSRQNLVNNTQEQQIMTQLEAAGKIPFGIVRDMLGLDQKVINNYRRKDQGTYSDQITRELIDETVKQDPSLGLMYVAGKDPIDILKKVMESRKIQEDQEKSNNELPPGEDSGVQDIGDNMPFDSSAPIDLGDDSQNIEDDLNPSEPGPETPSSGNEGAEPPLDLPN